MHVLIASMPWRDTAGEAGPADSCLADSPKNAASFRALSRLQVRVVEDDASSTLIMEHHPHLINGVDDCNDR